MQKGLETFPAYSWIYSLCMQWMHKHEQDVSSCHYLQLGCCCPAPVAWWFIKSYLCLSQYFLLLPNLFAVSSAAPLHCFDLWFTLFYFLQSSAVFIYVALKSPFANVPVPATSGRPPSLPAHNIIPFFWISHCFLWKAINFHKNFSYKTQCRVISKHLSPVNGDDLNFCSGF